LCLLTTGCGGEPTASGVYIVAPDMDAPKFVGGPPGAPVWSPDGRSLAWGSEDGLYLSNLENGSTKVLWSAAVAGRPAFAPDGSAIAMVDAEARSLQVIAAETGERRTGLEIAAASAPDARFPLVTLGGPAWSPDGRQIAFPCWDGAGDELCLAGSDGRGRWQVTQIEAMGGTAGSRAVANSGAPAWSPDGRLIAIGVYPERRGAPSGVFLIDPVEGEASKISSLQPNSGITWFPDGESLLFSATQEGRSDAYRVALGGSDAENLTSGLAAGARWPALDRGAARLAAASGGEIVIIDLMGGGETTVGAAGTDRFPAWSADGVLAFAADIEAIDRYE
jgi:Tol biopolymer transport system component